MYRYMTFMWSCTNSEAGRVAQNLVVKLRDISPHMWSLVWGGGGLAIYHSGEHKGRMQAYRLHGEQGVVLGRLFRSDYTSVIEDFDERESSKCLATKGHWLIDRYWGFYNAFLNDPSSGTRYVLRDPSGTFPCFYSNFRGVAIYFSDMQDAANFEFLPFTVNWDYLRTNMLLPQFRTIHTGLNEVREIQPGECVEETPFEKRSRFVWRPIEISQTEVMETVEEAAESLRETVMNTIGALVRCYERVVHNLGGLDSSIALASMAQAPTRPEITCLNLFTDSPCLDERDYARQMAEKYGFEIVQRKLDHRKVDLRKLFSANKLAKARATFDGIELAGDALALVQKTGAQALTYGTGGDNVYYQSPTNLGGLDYVGRYGLFGREILRVAMEASRYGRKSISRTFRDMLREYLAPQDCYGYVHDEAFQDFKIPLVNPDFLAAGDYERFLSPLLIPNRDDLKGKFKHVLSCALCTHDYYHHFDTRYTVERVRLYFSQPIIEACLRIPTWMMTYGGVDRGLARKAFSRYLTPDVARRFSKGAPTEYYRNIYEHNVGFIRDILRDGFLVNEGVLLRSQLERVLNKEALFVHVSPLQLLGYAELEAWLAGWIQRPNPKAV